MTFYEIYRTGGNHIRFLKFVLFLLVFFLLSRFHLSRAPLRTSRHIERHFSIWRHTRHQSRNIFIMIVFYGKNCCWVILFQAIGTFACDTMAPNSLVVNSNYCSNWNLSVIALIMIEWLIIMVAMHQVVMVSGKAQKSSCITKMRFSFADARCRCTMRTRRASGKTALIVYRFRCGNIYRMAAVPFSLFPFNSRRLWLRMVFYWPIFYSNAAQA